MKTKDSVLYLLKTNNDYISGSKIANELDISRNAIWKCIKQLQEDGYTIISKKNKGYKLLELNDTISKVLIDLELNNKFYQTNVIDSVTSTNVYLKNLVENDSNLKEGYTVLTGHQTNGKGRFNRSFYSPKDTGLYFSILLRPKYDIKKIQFITIISSIAVCETIKEISNLNVSIKWVNDILIDNLKVSGILTEATMSIESNTIDYVILGIGLNIYKPENDFPKELQNIATYIFKDKQNNLRNTIASKILNKFYYYYESFNEEEIVNLYRKYSYVINSEIYVHKNNSLIEAKVLEITDNCNLKVIYQDNTVETLSSGEVSIKLKEINNNE